MGDTRDHDEALSVVDRIDDAMVAYANAVVVTAGELRASDRTRIRGKTVDRESHTVADGSVESTKLSRRGGSEPNLVRAGSYSRTSAQGTPSSRSSRACRAVRLSSR